MDETQRFRINRPDVIHEILDEELVIVNLRTGAYFSLDRVGASVWEGVDRQLTRGEIVSGLLALYQGEASIIEAAATRLLDELEREQLIVAQREQGAPIPAPGAPANGRLPFAAPLLHKYTDMQELLLLDPIHEVDETGWPSREG